MQEPRFGFADSAGYQQREFIRDGFGNTRGNLLLRFESALRSLYEAKEGVSVALAWGFVSADVAYAAMQSMESLGGRVFGLVRRQTWT